MRKTFGAQTALNIAFVMLLAGTADSSAQSLQTWNGTISYNGTPYNFAMVGTDPSITNTTTTITVYIIPIRMVFPGNGTVPYVFDPSVDEWNGMSVVDALVNSPLFQAMDWQWGGTAGTDMGITQYVDAFQRGSFWHDVSINTSYHVVFAPVVLPEQVIYVPSGEGNVVTTQNGDSIGQMVHDDFDADLQAIMLQLSQVNPAVLPVFVTDNVDLCSNYAINCGQGGYHSSRSTGQTYVWSNFFTNAADPYPPDILSFTHELGEWMDDPFGHNPSPCGTYLEVADPLQLGHDITITSSAGLTWHLQALAFLQYFGEPVGFSANGWFDDVNFFQSVCGK